MSANEGLSKYLTTVHRQHASRGEVAAKVESIFEELELPWKTDGDIWEIDSDVGPVRAGLDDDEEVLSLFQLIHPVKGHAKKNGEYFAVLLHMNSAVSGAAFVLWEVGEGRDAQDWVAIVARIAAIQIDKEEVALALESVFKLSALYDQQ